MLKKSKDSLKACFKNVNILTSFRYMGCNDCRGGIYLNKQGICIFNSRYCSSGYFVVC